MNPESIIKDSQSWFVNDVDSALFVVSVVLLIILIVCVWLFFKE